MEIFPSDARGATPEEGAAIAAALAVFLAETQAESARPMSRWMEVARLEGVGLSYDENRSGWRT